MEKKLQEIVKRRPNRWGNLTVKEFERDIQLLQDAAKVRNQENELAREYLKDRIAETEYQLAQHHLLPEMIDLLEANLAETKETLRKMERSGALAEPVEAKNTKSRNAVQVTKGQQQSRNIEREYAFLYLRERIIKLEDRLKHDHLLPDMRDSLQLELSVVTADLAQLEQQVEASQ